MKITLPNITAAVLLILLTALVTCEYDKSNVSNNSNSSPSAKEIKKDKDNVVRATVKAAVSDSVRTLYVQKWKVIRTIQLDTLVKRDTVLKIIQVCDSALAKDSIAYHDLSEASRLKDILIAKQGLVMSADSSEIRALKKANKKLKRQRNGIIALWFFRESAGVAHGR